MTPGVGQLKSMCDAMKYAGENFTVADPRVSPAQAGSDILELLPPIMLVIGGNEQLLGENLEFAQKAQASGAHVQVEVFEGMWHDFVQESEGCGSTAGPLVEAEEALQAAAGFLNSTTEHGGCLVSCGKQQPGGAAGGTGAGGAAVVHWHYRYNYKPPTTGYDCRGIW